jgi:squalene synthase HpnC
MSSLFERQAADQYCRYLANRHYENFSAVSLILPAQIKLHLARIYAFCRCTDDLGDESEGRGLPRLEAWQAEVAALFEGAEPVHPVLLAVRDTVRAKGLPASMFLDLIEANIQDQTVSAYETWDALLRYCALSAAPVGRMVLGVYELREPNAQALSDDVCVGLQLANFAQDVGVDRTKGRTYLVQADIREYGVRGAVRVMCDRAEQLLKAGSELEAMAPGRLGVQLALYRLGGLAIVAAIRRQGYTTDERRPHLSTFEKTRLLSAAVRQSSVRRGYVPAHQSA